LYRGHVTRILADAIALLVFVTVGLLSHHGGVSATGYARDALPILGCWYAAAAVFGLYRRPTRGALLRTWAVGVTTGVALRQLVLWSFHWDDLVFLVVALTFTLLFVLVARALLVATRLSPRASRASA
jgi:hypothetical protein